MSYLINFYSEDILCPHFSPKKRPIIPAIIGAAAALTAAGISAGSAANSSSRALAGTKNTNQTNLDIARETNQANLDLYREQYQNAVDFWNKENDYNTASKQVQRLRDAGLNPAMAFGQGNVSSPVSLPSASPAIGATMQQAPYEAYSDTFMKGFAEALPSLSQSLATLEDYNTKNIDNQTRAAQNNAVLKQVNEQNEQIKADIKQKLSQVGLNKSERNKLLQELKILQVQEYGLNWQNRLNDAKYDDLVMQSKLMTKFQDLQNNYLDTQNNVLKEQNARDSVRLAIERFEADTHRRLSNAQIANLNVMAQIAQNVDFRDAESHNAKMMMDTLDRQLKNMQISETEKQNLFNTIMRESVMQHQDRIDSSALNSFAEQAIGFGFNALGNSIMNFLRLGK